MLKKISFLLVINIIILLSVEIIIKITLKALKYPTVYKVANINEKKYDYLTGFYNLPNAEETLAKYYLQGTDQYGFHLDGERFISQDLTKKDDNTPVTDGDLAVDKLLREKISSLTADIPIISEETVDFKKKNTLKTFWLIDPIDGTKE